MHQKTTLDNGLRILTSTMPHTRSVSICFFVGVGSRYESEVQAGISHFVEHLLFKGTSKRATAKEISETIEGVGGGLNGGTDRETTLYWARVAQPHFNLALDVLLDILLNSKFESEEMEKERQVIIEEINMTKDVPSQQVHLMIDELLWPGHPLGRDIAGTRESVTGTTRDMLLDHVESHYLPVNTVVAIAGDIQHEEAVTAVSQATGSWTKQRSQPGYLSFEEQPNLRIKVERRDTEQAHLCLALPGLPIIHPKRFTLDLLNVVLGEGMSSRLFTEIRDKLGLAYSIHSFSDHLLDSGAVIVSAGMEPGNLTRTVRAILDELSKLKEPIHESELTKAKELTKGRLLLRMEDTRSVAGWLGAQEILIGEILTVDQVVSIIDTITADHLQEIAWEIIVNDRLRMAVVGPVEDEESLEELLK